VVAISKLSAVSIAVGPALAKDWPVDMELEIAVLPVSDVDRAKDFYTNLGWRLDADVVGDNGFRVVQVTPPGSACSVIFGSEITSATPGSVQGHYMIVSDIEAARAELVGHGVEVGEVFHDAGGVFHHAGNTARLPGPDPQRTSYGSFASFTLLFAQALIDALRPREFRRALTQLRSPRE
jgi:catechol 2,3-dioxygenase-like lactoylglutathione lyase family enzyme